MTFDNNIINWLTEHNNPAIEYRTKVELLNEKADNSRVIEWIHSFLPVDWKNKKGLWLAYYYSAIVECGINGQEFGFKENVIQKYYEINPFRFGCDDFLALRAFVKLGLEKEILNIGIFNRLNH